MKRAFLQTAQSIPNAGSKLAQKYVWLRLLVCQMLGLWIVYSGANSFAQPIPTNIIFSLEGVDDQQKEVFPCLDNSGNLFVKAKVQKTESTITYSADKSWYVKTGTGSTPNHGAQIYIDGIDAGKFEYTGTLYENATSGPNMPSSDHPFFIKASATDVTPKMSIESDGDVHLWGSVITGETQCYCTPLPRGDTAVSNVGNDAARVTIDFADGWAGSDPLGTCNSEVKVKRIFAPNLQIVDRGGKLWQAALTHWKITTNRKGYSGAVITFKYTANDVAALGDEKYLRIYGLLKGDHQFWFPFTEQRTATTSSGTGISGEITAFVPSYLEVDTFAISSDTNLPTGFSDNTLKEFTLGNFLTDMAFSTDGRYLIIARKNGSLMNLYRPNVDTAWNVTDAQHEFGQFMTPTPTVTTTPTPIPIDLDDFTNSDFDKGLQGIALQPNFNPTDTDETNNFIYIYYTRHPKPNFAAPFLNELSYFDQLDAQMFSWNRVSKFKLVLDGDVKKLKFDLSFGEQVVLDHIPVLHSHCGGGLRFGDDGSLIVSTGEGATFAYQPADFGGKEDIAFVHSAPTNPAPPYVYPNVDDAGSFRALDKRSLAGKILRLNVGAPLNDWDAEGAPGYSNNPFYTGNPKALQSKIWDLGLRNPFKIYVRPGTGSGTSPGDIYISDVGGNRWEEVNVSRGATGGGHDFGWPAVEGPLPNPDFASFTSRPQIPTYRAGNAHSGTQDGLSWNYNTQVYPYRFPPYLAWPHVNHYPDNVVYPSTGITYFDIRGIQKSGPSPEKHFHGASSIGVAWKPADPVATPTPTPAFNRYPAPYQDGLFIADYLHWWIRFVKHDGNGNPNAIHDFGFNTVICGAPTIDPLTKELYYLDIDLCMLQRIEYNSNHVQARPMAFPNQAPSGAPITFYAGFSREAQSRDFTNFEWSVVDTPDTAPDAGCTEQTPPYVIYTGTDPKFTHTFCSTGPYSIKLKATRNTYTSEKTIPILVGTPLPAPVIQWSASGNTFPEILFYTGESYELPVKSNTLPSGTSYSWNTKLTHSTEYAFDIHQHPAGFATGVVPTPSSALTAYGNTTEDESDISGKDIFYEELILEAKKHGIPLYDRAAMMHNDLLPSKLERLAGKNADEFVLPSVSGDGVLVEAFYENELGNNPLNPPEEEVLAGSEDSPHNFDDLPAPNLATLSSKLPGWTYNVDWKTFFFVLNIEDDDTGIKIRWTPEDTSLDAVDDTSNRFISLWAVEHGYDNDDEIDPDDPFKYPFQYPNDSQIVSPARPRLTHKRTWQGTDKTTEYDTKVHNQVPAPVPTPPPGTELTLDGNQSYVIIVGAKFLRRALDQKTDKMSIKVICTPPAECPSTCATNCPQ